MKYQIFWLMLTLLPAIAAEPEAEIEELIEKAYIHGAFNEQNTADMAAGFHPDFAIFSAGGEELRRYPIATWIEGIEKGKQSANHDPDKARITHRISNIQVTGGAATAKIEIFKQDKQIYTDYLSFLRFDSGWKIVAKVYHKHP